MATTLPHSPIGIIVTSVYRPLPTGGNRPVHASRYALGSMIVGGDGEQHGQYGAGPAGPGLYKL
jgi:hypothetical protein